jgi:hypothetical protein
MPVATDHGKIKEIPFSLAYLALPIQHKYSDNVEDNDPTDFDR